MNSDENAPHLTAKIVSKYVSHHKLAATEIPELIVTVHKAMKRLGRPDDPEEAQTPAVSVRQSVRQDHVICLDCGYRGLILRRHISVRHGLNPDEYRQRWGLKGNHPLTAPAYSERRSSVAKALGFGRKPANRTVVADASAAASVPVEADEKSASISKPIRKRRGATKRAEAAEPADPAKPARAKRTRRTASQSEQPTSPAVNP